MEPQIQTKEFDDFYLITGKALFIASDFENDLKAVSAYFEIITNPDTPINSTLIELISEKFKSSYKRAQELELEPDLFTLLSKAIKSRNYIAHELALSIYNHQGDLNSITMFIEREIKSNVENVLIASCMLKGFLAEMNNEPTAVNWIEKQIDWVCVYEN